MLEKRVEAEVSAYCLRAGIMQQKFVGRRGCTDRIYFLKVGAVVLIEFKKAGKKADSLQLHNQAELKKHRQHCYVCDNSADAILILKFWDRRYSDYAGSWRGNFENVLADLRRKNK